MEAKGNKRPTEMRQKRRTRKKTDGEGQKQKGEDKMRQTDGQKRKGAENHSR